MYTIIILLYLVVVLFLVLMADSGVFGGTVHRNGSFSNQLVRIIPVQTDNKHVDRFYRTRIMKRKWKAHLGRFFHRDLTAQKLKGALTSASVNMENVSIAENRNIIFYQYKNKPLIALNLKDGHFYATQKTIDKHGLDFPQQQAHILTQILKKSNLSSATCGRAKFTKVLGC